ncbi:MAG: hypothetical protein K2X87_27495 [Gemmataceae bacterium]|nr:hypothetical protein [Gemmataceae bacterium]
MARRWAVAFGGLAVVVGVGLARPAADGPLRYKWQPGQTLTYRVQQQTVVQETAADEKTKQPVTTEARTTLALTRAWTVKDVDPAGTATLEMRITALKTDIRQPDGDTVSRDSANPDHAREMAEYLNKPVVVVRVDAQGRLVEVKEAKGGSAARLHAELPFRLTLPDAGPAAGQSWERTFAVKLDPPHGTGESYDFVQTYTAQGVQDGLAVVGVRTALKAPPKAPPKAAGEQVPLVPMLWAGEVYFDPAAGKYHAARLTAKAELVNHQGDGTKFVYQSTYAEDAAK